MAIGVVLSIPDPVPVKDWSRPQAAPQASGLMYSKLQYDIGLLHLRCLYIIRPKIKVRLIFAMPLYCQGFLHMPTICQWISPSLAETYARVTLTLSNKSKTCVTLAANIYAPSGVNSREVVRACSKCGWHQEYWIRWTFTKKKIWPVNIIINRDGMSKQAIDTVDEHRVIESSLGVVQV